MMPGPQLPGPDPAPPVVLNVDDEESIRYAKRRSLEQAGYAVVDAASGGEALRMVAEHRPALVLLDVRLPDINGIEVCRRIKQDYPGTMVLQISATVNTSAGRVRSLRSGADSYLTQPVEPEELAAAVHALLRIRDAEQAVRDSELRFRTLVEVTRQVVWLGDATGRITYWNPYWHTVTGLTPEQTAGEGWLHAVHPFQRKAVRTVHRQALATGTPYAVELQLRHAGDRMTPWRWFTARGQPVHGEDGGVRQWVGNMLEVDALKRAEQEGALLTAIVTSTSDAVVSFSARDGRILSCNKAAEALFGLPSGVAIGGAMELVLPDPMIFRHALSGQRVEVEARRTRASGEVIDLAITAARMLAPDGRVLGVFAILRDIGERKRAEAAQRTAHEMLEAMVTARTRDLTEANARLLREAAERERAEAALRQAQKLEALGQLAGGIAHDVNNTLQAVLGGARLIARRAPDAAAVERLARMVVEATERGAGVVRRLLAFARRDALHAEAVDLAALLSDLAEMLAPTLGAQIAIDVQVEPGLPLVLVDRGQFGTVLVNLAVNARDALEGVAGARLRLEAATQDVPEPAGAAAPVAAAPPVAAPAGLAPGRYIRIVVADNGTGIPPAILGRVTEPFFTTKPHGQGTGLGLPMAKGFAEQSGGAMTIESPAQDPSVPEAGPHRGTRVTLWLPQALDDAHPPHPGHATPGEGPARLGRVLLVDDDRLVRGLLSAALREAGHEVLEAEDAAAALQCLSGGAAPALLLTDLSMPGGNGADLIRDARRLLPGLPAMLMTGYVGGGAVEAVGDLGTGPFALLHKPVDPERFADAVMSLLAAEPAPG